MSGPEEPSFRIPLVELFRSTNQLSGELHRFSGKVDQLVEALAVVRQVQDDQENRIRKLESGRWPLPAVAVVVSAISLGLVALPMLTGS